MACAGNGQVFVMQLISIYQESFRDAQLPVWLHTYKILSTSKTTGLIELIKNGAFPIVR